MTEPAPLVDTAALAAFLGIVTDSTVDTAVELTEDLIYGEVGALLSSPPQPGVRAVAFTVAARMLSGLPGVRSETAGGISVSYADVSGTVALSATELARLRRAVGATVVANTPVVAGGGGS